MTRGYNDRYDNVAERPLIGTEASVLLAFGMQYSGVTVLEGALRYLGYDQFGEIIEKMPNEMPSFSRHEPISRLHERALGRVGSSWSDILSFSFEFSSTGQDELINEIKHTCAEGPCEDTYIYEPQMCLFANAWLAAFGSRKDQIKCLLIMRSPRSVANLLLQHEGLPRPYSLILWLRYVLASEVATRDQARTIVMYEDFVQDPDLQMRKIGSDLRIELPSNPESVRSIIESLKDLRLSPVEDKWRATGVYAEEVCDVAWLALKALSSKNLDYRSMKTLDVIRNNIETSVSLLRPAVETPWNKPDQRALYALHLNGTRIRTEDRSDVWLVYHGERHRITSPAAYDALFTGTDDIKSLSSVADIVQGPDIADGACLVKGFDGTKIYFLNKSSQNIITKHHIESFECFCEFGFDLTKVKNVPALCLDAIMDGRPLTTKHVGQNPN